MRGAEGDAELTVSSLRRQPGQHQPNTFCHISGRQPSQSSSSGSQAASDSETGEAPESPNSRRSGEGPTSACHGRRLLPHKGLPGRAQGGRFHASTLVSNSKPLHVFCCFQGRAGSLANANARTGSLRPTANFSMGSARVQLDFSHYGRLGCSTPPADEDEFHGSRIPPEDELRRQISRRRISRRGIAKTNSPKPSYFKNARKQQQGSRAGTCARPCPVIISA